jgi:hypothetical protein
VRRGSTTNVESCREISRSAVFERVDYTTSDAGQKAQSKVTYLMNEDMAKA